MKSPKQRISKQEWLQTGLEILEREGVSGVRVERMARALGIAKSGFYWHFSDRQDLHGQMLEYWLHEYTEVVSGNAELMRALPKERLRLAMHMILDHDLARFDMSMRAWAGHDPKVARTVRRVWAVRLEFIRRTLAEAGFEGEDLEMRTRLFVCYHTWERTMFWKEPRSKLRRLIDRRLELLLRR